MSTRENVEMNTVTPAFNKRRGKRETSIMAINPIRGAALVEITLVLPLLLLTMLVCFDIGRLLYTYNTLTKISLDGARFLSTRAYTGSVQSIDLTPEKIQAVKNFMVYGDEAGGDYPVIANLSADHITVGSSGDMVTVTVNYPFIPLFGAKFSSFGYGDDIDLLLPLVTTTRMRAIN